MSLYTRLLRPALFRLSPDASHGLAQRALAWAPPWRMLSALAGLEIVDLRLRCRFAGLELPNPIGLAAGFDKNCDLVESLSALGFGFLTLGSIMPAPRFGNPFPRLVRYPETQSLVDAMGVPSKGRDHALARLRRFAARRVPLIANIGGFSAEELAAGFLAVEPHVDAVEISLMCPNVMRPGETFDEAALLTAVFARLEGRAKPAIVRVPNDTTQSDDRLAELVERAIEFGAAGLKVGGGRRIEEPRLGAKLGTLHGAAIFETGLRNVERVARIARGRIDIKGNGGIRTAADVRAMLRAGAVCVDLYSAFIYEGWAIARNINRDLVAAMDRAAIPGGATAVAR